MKWILFVVFGFIGLGLGSVTLCGFFGKKVEKRKRTKTMQSRGCWPTCFLKHRWHYWPRISQSWRHYYEWLCDVCTVSCVHTGGWLQDVWCHVQVQTPLQTSSAPSITLTGGKKGSLLRCISASPYHHVCSWLKCLHRQLFTNTHILTYALKVGGESELLIWKASHRPRQTSARTACASEALIPWRRFFCTLPLISSLSARCVTNLSGHRGWGYTSADLTGPTVWPCVDILQHCGGRDRRKSWWIVCSSRFENLLECKLKLLPLLLTQCHFCVTLFSTTEGLVFHETSRTLW